MNIHSADSCKALERKILPHIKAETLSIMCKNRHLLIIISNNTCIEFWSVDSGRKIWQYNTHFTIEGVSVDSNDTTLLVYGEAHIATLNMSSWEIVCNIHMRDEVFHAGFLGVTQSVAVTTYASGVFIFRDFRRKPLFIFPHHMEYYFPLISKDEAHIITLAHEKHIAVWDAMSGELLWEKYHSGLGSVALTRQDKYVSFFCSKNSVTLWELESGKEIFHQELGAEIINIRTKLPQSMLGEK